MSPLTDTHRYKDIMTRTNDLFAQAALPRFDPVTGKENPFVMVTQAHEDIRFLLQQIIALQNEVYELEDRLEADDDWNDGTMPKNNEGN